MADFQNGPFGCFNDPRLCILTFCVPCYTVGKNAESVGEDCLLNGLLYCVGINVAPVVRWRLRESRGLPGSMLLDVLLHTLLPCCALVQEAQEIGWASKLKTTAAAGASNGGGKGETNAGATPEMARE